jgi:hypothetical protein
MGGSKTSTNSKTTTTIPQEIRDRGTSITNAAMGSYFDPSDPTKGFTGANPQYSQFQQIGQNTTGQLNNYNGQGGQAAQQFNAAGSSYQPYISGATGIATAAGSDPNNIAQKGSMPNYSSDALQQFMNPYQQNVIDQGVTQIGQDLNAQQQQNGASAAMAGAFGGARHGIIDSQAQKTAATTLQNFIGTQLNNGYNNSQNQFNTNVNQTQAQNAQNNAASAQNFGQQTSLAQIIANLGQQKQSQQLAAGNADLAFGNNLTAQDQAQKTNAYNYGYMGPMDVYNNLAAMNAMQPVNRTSTTNGTTSQSGGWLGPLLGAAGSIAASDEGSKENITDLDPEEILGAFSSVPPKSYDYKPEVVEAMPDLAKPGRRNGFMAQDIERAFGVPAGPEINGVKTVDLAQLVGNLTAAVTGLERRTRHLKMKKAA